MKNNTHSLLLFTLIIFMPYSLSAQTALPNNPAILPNDFNELLKPETTDGWFFLKDSLYVYPDTLFTKYKNWWGLGTNDKMKFEKKLTDKIGGNHYDYKLFHKGIEVYPLMVRVHDYIEKGLVANGRLIKNLAIDTSVIITKAQAISNALYNINATKYYWEDSIAQSSIKSIKNNQNATYYPNPVLVIIHLNADRNFNHVDFKLAYKLIVGIKEPEDNILTYFIDAKDGSILRINSNVRTEDANICTNYYGTQKVQVEEDSIIIKRFNGRVPTKPFNATFNVFRYCNFKDTFPSVTRGTLHNLFVIEGIIDTPFLSCSENEYTKSYSSVHWGLDQFRSLLKRPSISFLNQFERKMIVPGWYNLKPDTIFDGYDAKLVPFSFTGYAAYMNDPLLNVSRIVVGPSDINKGIFINNIDVIGHELGHHFANHLIYEKESGALNESFADIFGFLTQENARPLTGLKRDWLMGEHDFNDSLGLRNFKSPKKAGGSPQPDYYRGDYWVETRCCVPNNLNDGCGVHTNSGVQNKWFYLITDGDTLTQNGDFF